MLVSAKLSNNLWHGLKHVFLESGILNINDYKIKISIKFENCWQFSKFWRYQNFSQDSFPYVKLNKHIHLVSIKMCFAFNMFNKSCLGINFLWLSVNILFICVYIREYLGSWKIVLQVRHGHDWKNSWSSCIKTISAGCQKTIETWN